MELHYGSPRLIMGFLGGTVVKNLPANARNARDAGSVPVLERSPGERNGNPLQLFVPGEVHGQRSPVGYSPWGHKESGMTE